MSSSSREREVPDSQKFQKHVYSDKYSPHQLMNNPSELNEGSPMQELPPTLNVRQEYMKNGQRIVKKKG